MPLFEQGSDPEGGIASELSWTFGLWLNHLLWLSGPNADRFNGVSFLELALNFTIFTGCDIVCQGHVDVGHGSQ